MCLMCESYFDHCTKPECIERAKNTDAQRYEANDSKFFESEYFRSNQGLYEYFLWRGYSEPCEHIRSEHGSECNVIKPQEQSWSDGSSGKVHSWFGFNHCNCDLIDGEWEYF